MNFTKFFNVIDGKLTTTSETRYGINPSTLEANARVPVSTAKEVEEAITAATAAAKKWADVPYIERQNAILAFAEALIEHKSEFADLLTREQGKTINLATVEIINSYQWLTEIAKLEVPDEIVEETDEKKTVIIYRPLGVALAIVPWNFPVSLACGKIAAALISGCSMILKPSPFTPYCDLKLVELGQKFFPPGVLQALSGGDDLGPMLTAHPGIKKISFTGSSATGKLVMQSASKNLTRVTLELGGNDPAIICDDVDIKAVAPMIATMAFLNSGQICVAIKRIYVHSSIYDEFRTAVVEFTKTLQVGDGHKPGVFLGPIQNKMQYERVNGFLAEIEKENLNVAVGGRTVKSPDGPTGYFIQPTIVDNPSDDSRIVVEEPFGPVVPLLRWTDEEEVIARANHSNSGLGASVWSKDLTRAARMARKLDAGSVWVNTHMEVSPNIAFGGHKHSGIGSELGVAGLKSYCDAQVLYLKK